ncbi:MAG: isoprenylcysteine carboxylmethyltransferase family protein [Stappiaceae bacterium]
MKRVPPPLLVLLGLICMAANHYFFSFPKLVLPPYNTSGLVMFVAGILAGALGVRKFRSVKTNINPLRKPDLLVTDGIYRYSRNPMYLGQVFVIFGVAIYLGTLADIAIAAGCFLVMDLWFIRQEETVMRAAFGERFDDYCAKVRRWI